MVSFSKLARDPQKQHIWTCPYCTNKFGLRRSYYYHAHYKGRCLPEGPQQQQQWQAAGDPLDDWEAADDLQTAEVELDQRLVSFGLNADQQFSVLQLLLEQQAGAGIPSQPPPAAHMPGHPPPQQQQQQQPPLGDPQSAAPMQQPLPDPWWETEQGEYVRRARQRAEELSLLRDQPLFEGAQCCALKAHLLFFNWYCQYAIKNRAFEDLLEVLGKILPTPNLLSRSFYLFRKVSQRGGAGARYAVGCCCCVHNTPLPGCFCVCCVLVVPKQGTGL